MNFGGTETFNYRSNFLITNWPFIISLLCSWYKDENINTIWYQTLKSSQSGQEHKGLLSVSVKTSRKKQRKFKRSEWWSLGQWWWTEDASAEFWIRPEIFPEATSEGNRDGEISFLKDDFLKMIDHGIFSSIKRHQGMKLDCESKLNPHSRLCNLWWHLRRVPET